jgi:hypothetical protein
LIIYIISGNEEKYARRDNRKKTRVSKGWVRDRENNVKAKNGEIKLSVFKVLDSESICWTFQIRPGNIYWALFQSLKF